MKNPGMYLMTGLLIAAGYAAAQGQPRLEIEIKEQKVNMTSEEVAGADIVYTPGDTIEYTVIAKNTGDGVMVDPVIVDPIPEGVDYIVDSAAGENCRIIFSVDKGMQYSVWPIIITATTPGGVRIEREARKEEVTHIKWQVKGNIPPGGRKLFSFQVKVK